MNALISLLPPLVIGAVSLYALSQKTDVFAAITDGAADGMRTVARIFPSMLALLTAVYMFRASGALDALIKLISPLLLRIGIPAECAPMMLIRPISGGGALAVASELITTHGADSLIGRTAAVMMGASETTFYVIAVYFGAAGIKHSRHAIPAALCADLAGFCAAALVSNCLWG